MIRRLLAASLVLAVCMVRRASLARWKKATTGTRKWEVKSNEWPHQVTLKLKLDDGKLTGALFGRNGETAIEDGQYKDGVVSFKVAHERNGQKRFEKYSGKLDGDTIKGKIEPEFPQPTQRQSHDWEAKRAKD